MISYKDISVVEYAEMLSPANFKMRPMWHQYAVLAKSLNENLSRYGVFNGVGTGKTLSALYLAWVWKCKKILVVCPYSAFPAWEKNIQEGTDWTYQFLTGSGSERVDKLNANAQVFIINYEGLKTIYGCRTTIEEELDDGSISTRTPWQVEIGTMIDNFDCLIIDEFHKCGGFTSMKDINVQTKILNTLVDKARCVFGLTGTPFKNEMINVWALFYILDRGKTFGSNFFTFRSKYFYKYWYSWKLRPKYKEEILEKVAQRSISFSKHECIDLPPLTRELLTVKKTPEQLQLERKIVLQNKLEIKGHVVSDMTGSAKVQKLRQIQGGFVYISDENSKENTAFRINSNKPQALKEFLQSCFDEKVVIFHQYVEEGRIIEEVCKKCKLKSVSIRSETKRPLEAYRQFAEDATVKVMIAHPDAAKESYDMSMSSILVFYSFSSGFLQYDQCIGRIERYGQQRRMTEIFLLTEDGLDEITLASLDNHTNFMDDALRYIQEYDA